MAAMHDLSLGQIATLAALLEVTASKPGNVHRGADFDDLRFDHFAVSAVAIAAAFERAAEARVGETILGAVTAMRQSVATNATLGTILLFAPLAKVPRSEPLPEGVARVLAALDADDARDVYAAISLAQPGGMGEVQEMDVAGPPPADLIAAMRAASARDLVARQYINDFTQVLDEAAPWIVEELSAGAKIGEAIVRVQMRLMHRYPDSLIARKCGLHIAERCAWMAGEVLKSGRPGEEPYHEALADFDFWLRSDGHRRNPGTTADILAAALFALLRDGRLPWPLPL
jgi:triphosphoribosyl-dephospho-CoA synthase